MARARKTLEERFWLHVEKGDGCWMWTGDTDEDGYGRLWDGHYKPIGKVFAHRVSFAIANGPVASSVNVNHHCDTPGCVNPAHLYAGTQAENLRDMTVRGRRRNGHNDRTECVNGHPFTEDNVYRSIRSSTGQPHRQCRECKRAWDRAHPKPPTGGHNRDKTVCIRGHAVTPENTLMQNGCWRACRECRRMTRRDWKRAHRRRAA